MSSLPDRWWFDEHRACPQPFPDCRPGACNCDGVRDSATFALAHRAIPPAELARCAYIAGVVEAQASRPAV